ncbi:MAG: type IV pilus assembly protein PilM [Deltaproteobacteria bacterium]|nr:type IV pilus assembly protein PilM [Deltaproteobacteria bacterium]
MAFWKPKNLVGLDIGSHSIKIVELKHLKGGYELKNFGVAQLPPEAIVDGVIMDSAVVVESIRSLASNLKLTLKNVATSVAGHSLIIKKIQLPLMTETELEEQIQWEAEQYIPFEIEDVNIDFQILGPLSEEEGQMEVLLVAVKKDIINDYTAVISEAGLAAQVVDVDAFALENAFEVGYPEQLDKTVVLIDVGAGIMNINVLKGGVSTFTRDITIGGSNFTEEIQKELGVSYEEAEILKLGGSSDRASPAEVLGVLRLTTENLVLEIQRSLDFFSATSAEEEIHGIFLSGGTCRVPGLAMAIEERVGIPVEIFNPFRGIACSDKLFDPDYLEAAGPVAAVSVGLALRRTDER